MHLPNKLAPVYKNKQSSWYGTCKAEKFRLALCFYSMDGNNMSFALSYISSYAKKQFPNIDVHIFAVFAYSEEYAYTPCGVAGTISQWNPDMIAVSLMSVHWDGMDMYLHEIKRKMPDVPLLIGGYQAILNPEETIKHPDVDFICSGDGELPVADLIRLLYGEKEGPVAGLWEKMSDGSVFCTESVQINDLNILPYPDYDIYYDSFKDFSFFSSTGSQEKKFLFTMYGRGCPYRCTYCSNSALLNLWRDKKHFLRKYEIEKYIGDLCRLKNKYNYDFIEFWDENFASNRGYIKKLLKLYKKKVGLPFSISCRVEELREDMCRMLSDAGCYVVYMGIESGNEEYRSSMLNRKMTNEQIKDAVKNCRKAGIRIRTYVMAGMPFETKDMLQESLDFVKSIAPDHASFYTYIPVRGTKLHKIAEQAGLILSKGYYSCYEEFSFNKGVYNLNIKEHEKGMTNKEFNEMWQKIFLFQVQNNRLRYDD